MKRDLRVYEKRPIDILTRVIHMWHLSPNCTHSHVTRLIHTSWLIHMCVSIDGFARVHRRMRSRHHPPPTNPSKLTPWKQRPWGRAWRTQHSNCNRNSSGYWPQTRKRKTAYTHKQTSWELKCCTHSDIANLHTLTNTPQNWIITWDIFAWCKQVSLSLFFSFLSRFLSRFPFLSFSISLYLSLHLYAYVYIYINVCIYTCRCMNIPII